MFYYFLLIQFMNTIILFILLQRLHSNPVNIVKWCEFDASYVDRMFDAIDIMNNSSKNSSGAT